MERTSAGKRRQELRIEIEAAKLRQILDSRLGRKTPQWVKDLASRDRSSETLLPTGETAFWQSVQNEFGMLAPHHVAEFLGRPTERDLALRLNESGRILGLRWRGITQYPGYQFDQVTGGVCPVIAGIAGMGRESGWKDRDLLRWMCTPNDHLSRERPVDHIEDERRLLMAARADLRAPRS